MTKEQKPKKQPKQNDKKNAKKLGIAPVAIVDNIVFSRDEMWAFYQVSNSVYDFLSFQEKSSVALRISSAFNSLMSDREEPLDCYFLGSSMPIDVEKWYAQMIETSSTWKTGNGFEKYITEQAMYLDQHEYVKKTSILGVCLGRRGALDMKGLNVLDSGIKGAKDSLKQWIDMLLVSPGEYITPGEEKDARRKEVDVFEILSVGNLEGRRCTSEEILLHMKKPFYPYMPSPQLDVDHDSRIGAGDIELETAHAIEKKYRWLKITQMYGSEEVSGYRATMTFAKFPKETEFPNRAPFFYHLANIGAPFTFYARFTLRPSQKMKLELEKKKQEQKDEIENYSAGQDGSGGGAAPAAMIEAIEDVNTMSEILAGDKSPWVEGSYRIAVEAPTEDLLRQYCSMLKQQYDSIGILLQWTAGDQTQLLLEQMPGDKKRISSFDQITNLHMLAGSGMNFSSEVGDQIFGS